MWLISQEGKEGQVDLSVNDTTRASNQDGILGLIMLN